MASARTTQIRTLAVAALIVARQAPAPACTPASAPAAIAAEADSVARTAGWPIRLAPGADADLEIRAYIALGGSTPARAVRITQHSGYTTGARIMWWQGTTLRAEVPDDPERPIAQLDQEAWAVAVRRRAHDMGCGPVRQGGWVETCEVEGRPVDWPRALSDLQAAALDSRRSTQNASIAGAAVYVQVRAGSRLTTYAYPNPRHRPARAEDVAVARLSNLLLGLF